MKRVLSACVLVLALVASAAAQTLPSNIPDVCATPTITAVADGAWSAAATWSPARVPTVGDRVRVPAGRAVTYDRVSDDKLACLGLSGLLNFRTTGNTRLKVSTPYVYATGELRIGTAASPLPATVTAEFIIGDTPIDTAVDPEQYTTGILAFGAVNIFGAPKLTFTRVTVEPRAGHTTFTLSETPTGWRVGDTIFIPDTRQIAWDATPLPGQWEERTITAINGNVVTFNQPLTWNHVGARNWTGALQYLPHVGNLTRNVTFRSENPSGSRGHFLATERAQIDIEYAAFYDMGRTTTDPLDSWSPGHIGTNQIGRYPIHLHHLAGPASGGIRGTVYQYIVKGCAIVHTPKWAGAIHNTHFGLWQDTVIYHADGAALVTEDGSERQNVIDHNFACRGTGTGGREAGGREGVGFWFRGVDNIVTNNVACNFSSDQMDSAYGYKYFAEGLGPVGRPRAPGLDLHNPANLETVNGNGIPVRQFEHNEVYGATESGLTFWWIGTVAENPIPNMPESVFKDTVVWHVFNRGVYHYPANHVTIDGFIMRGLKEESGKAGRCCQLGIDFGDYYGKDITYRHVDIQGRVSGFAGAILSDNSTVTIEHAYLENQMGFTAATMSNVSYSAEILRPRHYVVRDVTFRTATYDDGSQLDRDLPSGPIVLFYSDQPVRGVTLLDDIKIEAFNGNPNDNFRVFYAQQAPNYIVPQTQFNGDGTRKLIGAPVAGLTNQQAMAQYGVAVAGAVAPCTTTRSEVIFGFACPSTGGPRAPRAAAGPVVVTTQ